MTPTDKLADALPKGVWPDHLMVRDTGLSDDMGGLGQRIYTTAGAGYPKVKYIRADIASLAAPPAQGEWVMVPRKPTEAMRDAGNDGAAPYMVDAAKLWAQMLAASPQPAPAPVQHDRNAQAAAIVRSIAGMGFDSSDKEIADEAIRLARRWRDDDEYVHAPVQPPAPGEAELPPLLPIPPLPPMPAQPAVFDPRRFGVAYSATQMQDYARAAIAALRQQVPVPDAVRLRAKPLRWTEAGLPRTIGWKEWSEALMDYHISFDPEEDPEYRYTAACGEGEPERFATLEEAKKWCQADADEWVQKIALASQQESRNAD